MFKPSRENLIYGVFVKKRFLSNVKIKKRLTETKYFSNFLYVYFCISIVKIGQVDEAVRRRRSKGVLPFDLRLFLDRHPAQKIEV